MKQLLILRHAKAARVGPFVPDPSRPLTKRGKEDAAAIGAELLRRGLVPDLVLSSPAKRAKQTAKYVAHAAGFDGPRETRKKLYFTSANKHARVIGNVPNELERLLVVGHNPELEELVEHLTGEVVELGTASLVLIELDVNGWDDIEAGMEAPIRLTLDARTLRPEEPEDAD